MSLAAEHVAKSYRTPRGVKEVLTDVTALFEPGQSVAILGAPGSGKSTLMQILSGTLFPSSGAVHRGSRISFVAGASAILNRKLTMREMIRFVARLYGVNSKQIVDFVADFAELGPHLDRSLEKDVRDARARLLFTLSYALPFDIYLADEAIVGGPPAFRDRCAALVQERRKTSGLVFTTRNVRTARTYGDVGALLHEGCLTFFPTLDEAIAAFEQVSPKSKSSNSVTYNLGDEDEDDDNTFGLF
jgi:capsular polysaccharide transport system ATP-binding protein